MKPQLNLLIKKIYNYQNATLLGVGPMSSNVIRACFESAKENNYPLMFIASRNQIDLKKYGGGYVNGWDQFDFVNNIKKISQELNFPYYYICRDHGGPWQRDEERNAHLPLEEALEIAKESFRADIEAGFDLIMVDPTKDPFVSGKTVDIEFVIKHTIDLIAFCEKERKKNNIAEISYEVGTEETNGGLTTIKEYGFFLKELKNRLKELSLPYPTFAVGQTGTLVKSTIQAGKFDIKVAQKLSDMAYEHEVYLKEHNGDYLDEVSLLKHIPSKVSAVNVAPQFGTEETRGYINLCKIEESLIKIGKLKDKSNLREVLVKESIKTNRWKKWVSSEIQKLDYDNIISNENLSNEILEIAGHYTLNKPEAIKEKEKLFNNLKKVDIDGNRYIIDRIKMSVQTYVNCLNLKNSLDKIL